MWEFCKCWNHARSQCILIIVEIWEGVVSENQVSKFWHWHWRQCVPKRIWWKHKKTDSAMNFNDDTVDIHSRSVWSDTIFKRSIEHSLTSYLPHVWRQMKRCFLFCTTFNHDIRWTYTWMHAPSVGIKIHSMIYPTIVSLNPFWHVLSWISI